MRRQGYWYTALASLAAGVLVLLGLSQSPDQGAVKVSLAERSAISSVRESAPGDDYSEPSDAILRVGIAGVWSPTGTLEYYQELVTQIERQLGLSVLLILRPTYAEINDMLRNGRIDVAFVCSLAYVKGKGDFGMELLVVPQMSGKTEYYSYLIASGSSNAAGLQDLRGGRFAFADPLSNTGHLAPVYQLSLPGESPDSFFSQTIFTYSHDNSIMAVAEKLVDGAAVDSLVYDRLLAKGADSARRTKVIARWGPYGIPPVVVRPGLDPLRKQELQDVFLRLGASQEGEAALASLDIDRFVVASDDLYNSIREMKTKMGW